MREYLLKMKSYFDMLNAASHTMTDTNQILAILNGLGDEYESIIAIICSREVPYTLQHVSTLLLSHEGRILQKTTNLDASANYVNYKKTPNWGSQTNSSQTTIGEGETTMVIVADVEAMADPTIIDLNVSSVAE